jgi:hypothetical protein
MNDPSQVPPPPGPPSGPPPGSYAQPAPPPKKGLSPLAWVGIGCAVIAVLGMLVVGGVVAVGGYFAKKGLDKLEKNPTLTLAELAVRANPDVDLVSTDEEAGTITVKVKKTGEVMTLNAKDIENGHFEIKSKDGTTVFDASGNANKDGGTLTVTNEKGEVATVHGGAGAPQNLPAWFPAYPGGTLQGTFDTNGTDGRTVAFTVSTPDTADKVLSFYESKLKEAGLKVDTYTAAANGKQTGGTLTGSSDSPNRNVGVLVSSSDGQTQAVITLTEKQ